jgi:hypothetical protein
VSIPTPDIEVFASFCLVVLPVSGGVSKMLPYFQLFVAIIALVSHVIQIANHFKNKK